MQLPLVAQIREARRLAEEANAAYRDFNMLGSTLTTIDLLELRLARIPAMQTDVPGLAHVAEVAARWPELAWMISQIPGENTAYGVALQRQRALVEAARAHLKELADTSEERNHRLAHLQEDQQEALAAPQYADAVEELRAIGAEREVVAHAIGPVRQRHSLVEPVRQVTERLRGELAREVATLAGEDDSRGIYRARAVHMMETVLDALTSMMSQQNLQIRVPQMPALGADAPRQAILSAASAVDAELHEILVDFSTLGERLAREESEVSARLERLTQALLERLG